MILAALLLVYTYRHYGAWMNHTRYQGHQNLLKEVLTVDDRGLFGILKSIGSQGQLRAAQSFARSNYID